VNTLFDQFLQDPEQRRIFEQESLAFEAAELIATLMHRGDVSKTELAKRIGKSKAFVTQVLSGSRNMTLHTFADLAFALGHKIEVAPAPLNKTKHVYIVRPVRAPYSSASEHNWWIPCGSACGQHEENSSVWLTEDEVVQEPGIAA
jgi:hypothetical protein